MSRTKEQRYQQALKEPLLVQSEKSFFTSCKGVWRSEFFKNKNPLIVELACGRGEYTIGLAKIFPDKNFVGVDIKAERMMVGINRRLRDTGLQYPDANIAFLRTIIQHIDYFFASNEVSELRIVHPDPRPRGRDKKRRLTSERFLAMYRDILEPGGLLRLKTDDRDFFEYSLETLQEGGFILLEHTYDLESSSLQQDHHNITTHYGEKFQKEKGRTLKYAVRRNNK